jgi:UDP-N-acetylmuramoyl-L-alanyl-D-glutamate--2,6-diaminopimelate ligase
MGLGLPQRWCADCLSIGVTGTNGKTTTATQIAFVLARALQAPVFRATTVGTFVDDQPIYGGPDYDGFVAVLAEALDRGVRHAVLETTSESLARGFASVWPCKIGVFTNLTHDHLDAHESPEHYLASKAQLFTSIPAGGTAVLNARDAATPLLLEVLPAGVRALRYGVGPDLSGLAVRADPPVVTRTGTLGKVSVQDTYFGSGVLTLRTRALGVHFFENALAALLAALVAGVPLEQAVALLAEAPVPAGRFEIVSEQGEPTVVVDYAHTPDAIARTIQTAKALCARVTVVFGAGGDRDRAKRPLMGRAASAADRVILTTDNPRSEDPGEIAKHVAEGIVGTYEVVLERARAIDLAIREAGKEHLVLLLGKGHETLPFSDVDCAKASLTALRPARTVRVD